MKPGLRSKLTGGFAFLLLWMVAIELVNIYTSRTIEKRLASTVECDLKSASLLTEVGRKAEHVRTNSLLLISAEAKEDVKKYESEIAREEAEINALLDAFVNTCQDQAELDKLAEFRFAWETYSRIRDEQTLQFSGASLKEKILALTGEGADIGSAARTAFVKLEELQKADIAAAHYKLELAKQERKRSQNLLLFMTVLAAIPGLIFGERLSSQIANAIGMVSNAAQLLTSGDFDWNVSVKTGDEIESVAESLNQMARNVKKALAARREAAEQLQRESSERKRIEKILDTYKQRFVVALDLLNEGVIVTDIESKIVHMNKAAEKLTGWTQEQAVGKPLSRVFHAKNAATGKYFESTEEITLRSGKTIRPRANTLLIAKNGAERTIAYSAAPVRDQDGDFSGAVFVLQDIAQRVEQDAEA